MTAPRIPTTAPFMTTPFKATFATLYRLLNDSAAGDEPAVIGEHLRFPQARSTGIPKNRKRLDRRRQEQRLFRLRERNLLVANRRIGALEGHRRLAAAARFLRRHVEIHHAGQAFI